LSCIGSLILHADGTIAACTEDEEPDGCAGHEQRHEGDPRRCFEVFGGCNYCGVHA